MPTLYNLALSLISTFPLKVVPNFKTINSKDIRRKKNISNLELITVSNFDSLLFHYKLFPAITAFFTFTVFPGIKISFWYRKLFLKLSAVSGSCSLFRHLDLFITLTTVSGLANCFLYRLFLLAPKTPSRAGSFFTCTDSFLGH